jgi:hypothetical protein
MTDLETAPTAAALKADLELGVLVLTLDVPGEPVNTLTPRPIGEFESIFARVECDP